MSLHVSKQGFVKTIILIVIALIILGFFGFNLEEIVKRENVHNNLIYVWGLVKIVWQKFLLKPAVWVWNVIVVDLLWNNLTELVTKLKN